MFADLIAKKRRVITAVLALAVIASIGVAALATTSVLADPPGGPSGCKTSSGESC
jgi:hypothetical protein